MSLDLIFNINGTNGDIEINLSPQAIQKLDDSCGSIVFPFYNSKFIMTYHIKRKGWEFPAGSREGGETPIECAVRETFEETGALISNIIAIGYYTVDINNEKRKTAIYSADVERFEPKPRWSETDLVKIFDELPENISYSDDVYKIVLDHIRKLRNQINEVVE